jgi:hypothetical protein
MHDFLNVTFSSSEFTELNARMMVYNELERVWEESGMASFEGLSPHLPGMTEENQDK